MFYHSSYLEQNRHEYIERLRAIGRKKEAWNEWIHFFLQAITAQSKANFALALEIMTFYERLKSDVIRITNSKYGQLVVDAFFERPILQPSFLERQPGMPSKAMLMRIIKKLTEKKILSVLREQSGRRAQILALSELLQIVNSTEIRS